MGNVVVERVVYDPYGKAKFYDNAWANPSDTSAYANDILYCGYRFDSETGLYQVRYRYYHPTLGRWIGRDSIGFVDRIGLYEYVVSSPLVLVDPQGWESITVAQAIDLACNSIDKYRGVAKVDECQKICPEHLLAIFVRESRLDPRAYEGKFDKKSPPEPKNLGEYGGPAGLGGIRASSADDIRRIAAGRLRDYRPPDENQTGVDAYVLGGTKKNVGTVASPKYDYDNPDARADRFDPQANSDMATLNLIDKVSAAGDLQKGITRYGTGDAEYGESIMKAAAAIAEAAGCKNPCCCTCDELKAMGKKVTSAIDAEFRELIYNAATGR